MPFQDYGELEQSLRAVVQQRGLQQSPGFLKKAVQMWDTMCVRFGLMLVGPTGSGKTTCSSVLQSALTRLRQDVNHPNEQFQVRCKQCPVVHHFAACCCKWWQPALLKNLRALTEVL